MTRKPKPDSTHPEWHEAMEALVRALDLPDRYDRVIRGLVIPGLGRVFMRFWIAQDLVDPDFMADPEDDADEPQWYQIGDWPQRAGTPDGTPQFKWNRRTSLYFRWYGQHVMHVVDWLIYADRIGAPWLQNLDGHGRPKKLLKCVDLQQLVHEADKGLRYRARNYDPGGANPEVLPALVVHDEVEVADLGVGHVLVRLQTPNALFIEGRRMHHCIGHGRYDHYLSNPHYRFFSVRDPEGQPLATLEIAAGVVLQFRGPENADPARAVVDLLSAHAAEQKWLCYENAAAGGYLAYGFDDIDGGGAVVIDDIPAGDGPLPVRPRPAG
ncbi:MULTISPECIES: PcfJ domain-containing protein [Shinella]|jgi:hypothetical protein|uniref:PcfJ domain-containing protein n=1 Tax=Shinella TaxID=323620 RepID=UPI001F401349|nr:MULTISPECIES: PcfJ domain-containing protein [Shinella]